MKTAWPLPLLVLLTCVACRGPEATSADPATVTTTVTVTQSPAPSVTATVTTTAAATMTVTATVTEPAATQPAGPIDVTQEYVTQTRAAHMSREQQQAVVQAWLDGGVLNVLTDMRPDWGGWACDWEPTMLSGAVVKFSRILYDDGSLFRICH